MMRNHYESCGRCHRDPCACPKPTTTSAPWHFAKSCPHPERGGAHEVYMRPEHVYCRACGAVATPGPRKAANTGGHATTASAPGAMTAERGAVVRAFAEMVRHCCPESGPENERLASKAHSHLAETMMAGKREWDATVAALDATRAERDELTVAYNRCEAARVEAVRERDAARRHAEEVRGALERLSERHMVERDEALSALAALRCATSSAARDVGASGLHDPTSSAEAEHGSDSTPRP